MGSPSDLTKISVPPTLDEFWDSIARSLHDAEVAFPVLLTMLKAADLKQGAVVADEMMGAVAFAAKALPILRRNVAERTVSARADGERAERERCVGIARERARMWHSMGQQTRDAAASEIAALIEEKEPK